jgi:hypothetical protein
MDLGLVNRTSLAEAKFALFRSLFRGRDDVYARRFENRKSGKSGYAPACANEWMRGICEKPRIKCAVCPHRRFLPVNDEVIRWHLRGCDPDDHPFVAGVYPMLRNETCIFLAVDFDEADWRADANAFLETCRCANLPAALERSSSGRGGHLWLFFDEAIPAAPARRLGSYLLTETMEGRPDVGMDSYDRLFPNRDTLPQGGFGKLIALPLQKGPREEGNSVFLDDLFVPWADQWAFLASVRRIGRDQIEGTVQDAERRGRVLGVRLPPQDDGEEEPWAAPPSRRRGEAPITGELPVEAVAADESAVSVEITSAADISVPEAATPALQDPSADPWAVLLQAGTQLASALSRAGNPEAAPHPWLKRDPASGACSLRLPLPPPETARRLAEALSVIADSLRGTRASQ